MAINGVILKNFLNNPVGDNVRHILVIPDYQRPYAWEKDDQALKLFTDICDYANDTAGGTAEPYFLGTIVGYYNKSTNELEIIDGQQRITTLFLLLRAIYTRLADEDCNGNKNKEDVLHYYMTAIAQALWESKYGKPNFNSVSLVTKIESGAAILNAILQTGVASEKNKDNYSQNYLMFQNKLNEYFGRQILDGAYNFFEALIERTIVLPIIADSEDTALRIFTTLNDRGLPLSDADIFKAQIYRRLPDDNAKDDFISTWQNLSNDANLGGKEIQDLFTYYMFYLRACKEDTDTTTIAMRRYYAGKDNDFLLLRNPSLLKDIGIIASLLKTMNRNPDANDPLAGNATVLQLLDILTYYPNEFGKYPAIIFYLAHHSKEGFGEAFQAFLKNLIALAAVKFALEPSVNSIKGEVLKLNTEIIRSMHPTFNFGIKPANAAEALKTPNAKLVQLLLCVLAYNNPSQKELLKRSWQIEHILPQSQKWQEVFLKGKSKTEIREWVETFGNKLPLEWKINATASDDCFRIKKEQYRKSKIALVNQMAQNDALNKWDFDKIKERNETVAKELVETFTRWNADYDKLGNK